MSYLGNLIKFAKKLVEHVDKFTRGAITGQTGETNNISVQNTAKKQLALHIRKKLPRNILKQKTMNVKYS